jgi:hypothetical protein
MTRRALNNEIRRLASFPWGIVRKSVGTIVVFAMGIKTKVEVSVCAAKTPIKYSFLASALTALAAQLHHTKLKSTSGTSTACNEQTLVHKRTRL